MKSKSSRLPTAVVRVMCTGRVVGGDVLRAFENGAAGVLIVGCANDDCHYGFGSSVANENVRHVSDILSLLGLERERLQFTRVPSEDGPDLKSVMENFIQEIEKLDVNPIGEVR